MLGLLKGFSRSKMNGKRLIFCINSGRTGSEYLAKLLDTAPEVTAYHQPKPTMAGKYLSMINESLYHKTYSKRRVKCKAIDQELKKIGKGSVYCETSNMFIKTFFDVVMTSFKNVEVIVLRRQLSKVLKSFIELGYFTSKIDTKWPEWLSSPNAATAAIPCIDKDENLDHYDICIAYLLDIEARAVRFQKDYPNVKIHHVRLEHLNSNDSVEHLFQDLQITPSTNTNKFIGSVQNIMKAEKKSAAISTSLDYCKERLQRYLEKAQTLGIEIPLTFVVE